MIDGRAEYEIILVHRVCAIYNVCLGERVIKKTFSTCMWPYSPS